MRFSPPSLQHTPCPACSCFFYFSLPTFNQDGIILFSHTLFSSFSSLQHTVQHVSLVSFIFFLIALQHTVLTFALLFFSFIILHLGEDDHPGRSTGRLQGFRPGRRQEVRKNRRKRGGREGKCRPRRASFEVMFHFVSASRFTFIWNILVPALHFFTFQLLFISKQVKSFLPLTPAIVFLLTQQQRFVIDPHGSVAQ